MEQSGTFNQGIQLEDGTGNIEQEDCNADNIIGENETGGVGLLLENGDYIIQELS